MRRSLNGIQIGVRIALLVVFGLLIYGTVMVFLALDNGSTNDTMPPFLLTMVPVWLVTLWAARIVLRTR